MRALHLMADHVFTRDFITDTATLNKGEHDFLVYTESLHGKKFVQPAKNVFRYSYGTKAYHDLLNKAGREYTHLYVHWLSYEAGEAILSVPQSVKTGAFFWGNDFAEPTSFYRHRVFEPVTLEYFEVSKRKYSIKWRNNPRWRYALNPSWLLRTALSKAAGSKGTQKLFEQKKKAIARLDYFFHFNHHDLDWVNVQTPTNAQLIQFFYAAGYQEAAAMPKSSVQHKKLIVGNSASTTNNHADVLKRLSKNGIPKDSKVIVPLSYGDQSYAQFVIRKGQEYLGDAMLPLTDFMQRDAYFKLLGETTSAIFNVKRTQALGNINAMLAMGKKVFLNAACPMFRFYSENGFVIYDVEQAYADPSFAFEPLAAEASELNRQKLEEHFSESLRMKRMEAILNFRNV